MVNDDRAAEPPRQTPQQRTDEPGEPVEDVPATTPQARTEGPQDDDERSQPDDDAGRSAGDADPGRLDE